MKRISLIVLTSLGVAMLSPFAGCQSAGLKSPSEFWRATFVKSGSSRKSLAKDDVHKVAADSTDPVKAQQDLHLAMARAAEQQGDVEYAIADYRKLVRMHPTNALAWHRLGVLCDQQGHCEEAAEHYQRAMKLLPDNAELLADSGYNCYLRNRWSESETQLRRAIQLQPELKRAHNNLALVLIKRGQADVALRAFESGGCSLAEAHANVSLLLTIEGDLTGSLEHLEMAAKLAPDNPKIEKQRSMITAAIATQQSEQDNPPHAIVAYIDDE